MVKSIHSSCEGYLLYSIPVRCNEQFSERACKIIFTRGRSMTAYYNLGVHLNLHENAVSLSFEFDVCVTWRLSKRLALWTSQSL